MATSFNLLLVSNSVESQEDQDTASSVIASLIAQVGGMCYCDLSSSSVSILNGAFAKKKFDAFIETQWDPPKGKDSIPNHRLLSNDELCSFAGDMNATFETIDFDNYVENPEEYKPRIKARLFTPSRCLRIVVIDPIVVRTCMELLGQRSDVVPMLSSWKIWPEGQRGVPLKQVSDLARAQEVITSLLPSEILASMPINQSVVLDLPEDQGQIDAHAYSQTAHFLQEQVGQLSKQFSSELTRELDGVLAAYRMEGAGPAEHVAREVNETLQGLKKRFGETLLKLEERLRDVDEYKRAQKAEIDEVAREVRLISTYQSEVGNMLKRLEESLNPTIAELQERLAAIDVQQDALQKEVMAARQSKLSGVYPLTIRKIVRMEDNNYVAEVASRKHYALYGQLAVLSMNGDIIHCSNTIEFRGTQQVNMLTVVGLLQPGSYQVVILHYVDNSEISEKLQLDVEEEDQYYSHSLLYQERDMSAIENMLMKERGLEHVHTLRKLVISWQDPTSKRLDDFLTVFKDRSVEGEDALRDRLRAQGFTV